jgi:hypothetical protein
MQTGASSAQDTVQAYSAGTLERVKTFKGMMGRVVEAAQQETEQSR